MKKKNYQPLTALLTIQIETGELQSKAQSGCKQPIHTQLLKHSDEQANRAKTESQHTQPRCSDTG